MSKACILLQSIEKKTIENTRMTMRLNPMDGGKTLGSELHGSKGYAPSPFFRTKAKTIMPTPLKEQS